LRNRAAWHTDRDILVFCDANVETPREWVGALLTAFADPAVAAAGPAITDMYRRDFTGFGMCWRDAELNTTWLGKWSDQPCPSPLLAGSFFAVRRDVFQQLGGFDSNMQNSGAEDSELCLRLWTLGWECHVIPELQVLWMNPYSSGAIRTEEYWDDLLHNLLRL